MKLLKVQDLDQIRLVYGSRSVCQHFTVITAQKRITAQRRRCMLAIRIAEPIISEQKKEGTCYQAIRSKRGEKEEDIY